MQTPQLIPIEEENDFRFACHPGVPCFNECCRDLNQALTPYDVLCLKKHLAMTSQTFIETYATLYTGEATGLPVVSLRFTGADRNCPFVSPAGCRVYKARPSSCRTYPLARALRRMRADGRVSEHFAVIREPHCKGFEQHSTQTAGQWMRGQELDKHNAMNDRLMALIALKNQVRPGELSPEHRQMTQWAFYDLETLTRQALENRLPEMHHDHLKPLPQTGDDERWLIWGLRWLKQALFGVKGTDDGFER